MHTNIIRRLFVSLIVNLVLTALFSPIAWGQEPAKDCGVTYPEESMKLKPKDATETQDKQRILVVIQDPLGLTTDERREFERFKQDLFDQFAIFFVSEEEVKSDWRDPENPTIKELLKSSEKLDGMFEQTNPDHHMDRELGKVQADIAKIEDPLPAPHIEEKGMYLTFGLGSNYKNRPLLGYYEEEGYQLMNEVVLSADRSLSLGLNLEVGVITPSMEMGLLLGWSSDMVNSNEKEFQAGVATRFGGDRLYLGLNMVGYYGYTAPDLGLDVARTGMEIQPHIDLRIGDGYALKVLFPIGYETAEGIQTNNEGITHTAINGLTAGVSLEILLHMDTLQ